MPLTNMTTPRNYASALQINPNQALIIGGSDVQTWMMFSSRNSLKSTETVSSSGAEKGKDFSDDIYGHCSFKINAIYGWVIGGYWLYFDATRQRIKIAQETRSKAAIRKKCLRNWIQDWVMLQLISQNLLISAVEQQHLQKQLKILSILFLFTFDRFDHSLYNQQLNGDQIKPFPLL